MPNSNPTPVNPVAPAAPTTFGALCTLVGGVLGAAVWAIAPGSSWGWIAFAAPVASFLSGYGLWRSFGTRREPVSRLRAAAVGAVAAVVGHWGTLFLAVTCDQIASAWRAETTTSFFPSIVESLTGASVLAFASLAVVGWITIPVGALLGMACRGRPGRSE